MKGKGEGRKWIKPTGMAFISQAARGQLLNNTGHYVTTRSDTQMSLIAIDNGQATTVSSNPLFSSETSVARSSSDNIGAPYRRARGKGGMSQRHVEEEDLRIRHVVSHVHLDQVRCRVNWAVDQRCEDQ